AGLVRALPAVAIFVLEHLADDRSQIEERIHHDGDGGLVPVGDEAQSAYIPRHGDVGVLARHGAGPDHELIAQDHVSRFARIVPVATPLASVGEAGCVMESAAPRSDESVMVFPETGWPFESRSVTVMVLAVTPSAGTNGGAATTVERVGLTPARTVTLRLFASAGSPSAFPAVSAWAAAAVELSSTVEPKAAVPAEPGASAVNVIRMFVSVAVTFVPSAIVITWPLAVAQDSPAAGTGQF